MTSTKILIYSRFRPTIAARPRRAGLLVILLLLSFVAGIRSLAHGAENLPHIKKLYVDSLGNSSVAVATRRNLIRRLQRNHKIEIVANPDHADAIVKGAAQVWTTGHVSLEPRSHSLVEPVVQGFLSVELISKGKQTLWSYLVTPSKFPWGGVAEDLARQMASRLLSAIEENSEQKPLDANSLATARATLKGAGATFPAPLYQKWFESFQEDDPAVNVSYDPVGSAEGIRLLKQRQVDFAASEIPLSHDLSSDAHPSFREVPSVLGAVVPIYNVEHLHQNLNFTPEILAAIYLGKITKWNDPEIKKINRGASLPDADIVAIHRSDGSGTTFVWTEYLSQASAEWKAKAGSDVTVAWPVGVAAERNEGVATAVQRTLNSIGYVEYIYAIQHGQSFGAVRNAAGEFVKADISSVTAAARTSEGSDTNFDVSLIGSSGKNAYPIATYTWLFLPDPIDDKEKKSALVELFHWILTSGQKSCSALGYAPLPADVAKRALEAVDRIQ